MNGSKRRELISEELKKNIKPITGTTLAKKYGVSRQIVVQDIALLRAKGLKVISTSEGYMIYNIKESTVKKIIAVKHNSKQIEDELTTIVDLGGNILNVFVTHPVYGEIIADMMISTRNGISKFLNKIEDNNFVPLMELTGEEHYHTIEAKNEDILKEIESELKIKGYLNNN